MDMQSRAPYLRIATRPLFLDQAMRIAARMQHKRPSELRRLMNTSDELTKSVFDMYAHWSPNAPGKAALWAYKGDVYKGVYADTLDPAAAAWAEQHIVILSGLYGLLRPHDAVQRYRLEMKAGLKVGRANNLYEFWSDTLGVYAAEHSDGVICCLSSNEYARAVLRHVPSSIRVVTPTFFDTKPNGQVGTVPIYSKMMRGVMARWIIDHRIDSPEGLCDFTGHGYAYDAGRSTKDAPAFYRAVMKPLVFTPPLTNN